MDPRKVAETKKEELKIAKEYNLYEKVPIEEGYQKTGKAPIGVRWVYVNKGDDEHPAYRARLCAKEVKAKDPYLEGVFVPTPPIEGLRLLLSLSFTAEDKKMESDCIMVLNATRAHWHSPANLAPEDLTEPGDSKRCARLLKSMYGCRDAAANWEDFSNKVMQEMGFRSGVANPCLMWHPKWRVRLFKHVHDFVLAGKRAQLHKTKEKIEERIKMKCQGVLGMEPEKGDVGAIQILNRTVSVDRDEKGVPQLSVEADGRHVEILLQGLGLKSGSKGRASPGEKTKEIDETPLGEEATHHYRSLTMRENFLSEDRFDVKFAAKEHARDMKAPTTNSWEKLKHLRRYLLNKPRALSVIKWQPQVDKLRAMSDSQHGKVRSL